MHPIPGARVVEGSGMTGAAIRTMGNGEAQYWRAGGVPGDPEEPGVPVQPGEPGEPTIPDQPPPAPVA